MVFKMSILSIAECVLLLICILGVNAQSEIGDLCVFDEDTGVNGICTLFANCEFARIQVYTHQRHMPICGYQGHSQIVCCPLAKISHDGRIICHRGEGGRIIMNSDMDCRCDGNPPMECCPKSNYTIPPEPLGCPHLPDIQPPVFGSPAEEVAWSKCIENRRYFDVCINENNGYKRQRVCDVNVNSRTLVDNYPLAKEFPHMAVLGAAKHRADEEDNGDIAWVGTGSLISDKFILTAAHIVLSIEYGRLKYALLGALNRTDLSSGELFNVVYLIPNNYYVLGEKHNDIALLELDRQVRFSEFIRPICLPTPGLEYEQQARIIAGWGFSSNPRTTEVMSKEYVFETNSDDCKSQLMLKNFTWNNDSMICARGYRRRNGYYRDTCQIGSGAPLMAIVTNEHLDCNYVLNGVTSWAPDCKEDTPTIYTRVSFYLDWIVQTVWPKELENVRDKLA